MSTPVVQTDLERRLQAMLASSTLQPSAQQATETAEQPVVEQPAQQPAVVPVVEQPATSHFADLLAQNETYRQQQSAAWEKREKEAKSRKTWAAISDALSSLGNLIGTGFGAANQQQTYQMPFVQRDIDEDRALARATAERLRANEQSLKAAEAKMAAQQSEAADKLAVQQLRNEGSERVAHINGQYGLQRVGMQQEGSNMRTAATISAANQRSKDSIAAANQRNADNIASREKIAADRIAQMDRQAKNKENSSRKLTENAKAQKILKDAEMGVLSDLLPELKKNGVQLPYEWAKNWRQYVKLAPEFYKKNFVDKGWGELGGKISDVYDDDDFNIDDYEEDDFDLSKYEV